MADSTILIMSKLGQQQFGAPSHSDPRLPAAIISDQGYAKISENITKLPDLSGIQNATSVSLATLKSVKSAHEQHSMLQGQLQLGTKKVEEYTVEKKRLKQKFEESKTKLLTELKDIFKGTTSVKDIFSKIKEDQKKMQSEVAKQKQIGEFEKKRLHDLQNQINNSIPPTLRASTELRPT